MNRPKKRKKPPRLERPKKQYSLDQCALYGIKGENHLFRALKWEADLEQLTELTEKKNSYNVWTAEDGRIIQAACPALRQVHTRIAVLLRRVVPPHYRQSGVRDRSFITNASQHLELCPSLKLDIKKFYPSTRFGHVRRFFVEEMKCAADIAAILARVCCYAGAIPTGGVHSEVLAFYCHKVTFDDLAQRVHGRGGRMTVYVDDIMITMPGAGHTDLAWAKRLFARQGIELHPAKSRVLHSSRDKVITGVLIRRGEMFALPDQHRKVAERMANLRDADDLDSARQAARQLLGHLDHIAQIDESFKDKATGNRSRLKRLLAKDPV